MWRNVECGISTQAPLARHAKVLYLFPIPLVRGVMGLKQSEEDSRRSRHPQCGASTFSTLPE
jgi:hypothetical protein